MISLLVMQLGVSVAVLRMFIVLLGARWTILVPLIFFRLSPGLNTVFVRLVGSGSALRIVSRTPGLDVCVGSGPVGVASYDN
jgi:hypothetical protein